MIAKFQKLAEAYLAKAVPDPVLRPRLTPDYPIGCKRVLISDDFYPSLQRDNVDLVTGAVAEIRPNGVVTADGKLREVDAIIYATGFRVTDWLSHVDIRGRGGRKLIDDWRDGASAYYGVAVNGYPNMFLLLGPNTGLGHNSVVFMIESQVRYAMDCLKWLWNGTGTVEVKADVQKAFNEDLHQKMKSTVWMSGCRSWYLNPNGTNSTIWPYFTVTYWWKTHRANRRDFDLAPVRVPAA
jgi:cation diffusion facilitator CzcD-associated flavoprotein CzcO